ncbi:unnamed protein product [Rhodiola kirilowii]
MAILGFSVKFQTYDSLLTECINRRSFRDGQLVHAHMIKTDYKPPVYLRTRLIVFYNKCDCLRDAREVFDEMPERNVVSWTAMISTYSKREHGSEALKLVMFAGVIANEFTFATVLTMCAGSSGFHLGRQVHSLIIKSKCETHIFVGSSLLDMYAKAGRIQEARSIFETLPERDVVSCTAIIAGYAHKHGMGREVVELFRLMKEDNTVKPDEITFLAVLSGCSHGRMQDRGLDIFDEMVNGKYGMAPKIEHYACVVDLLGRAGLVERAFEFVKQMPFEPTPAILGSLLGACRVHSNVKVGQLVGHRLLEMEPENAGNYVILSNLFASSGRWEDVRRLRELMTEKAVKKEPGRSWIELEQTLHTFHAGDRSHPDNKALFAKVKELSVKFREVGYVPDLSCVLHDVDDEQKEKILLGHSEKLALAFGLINTSKGVSLRVIKNLRICADCHSFGKFISKFYGRNVSLRDKNRFHHIVEGVCSCGDYW